MSNYFVIQYRSFYLIPDAKYLPDTEKNVLQNLASQDYDSMDSSSSSHQKLIPIFGTETEDNGAQNRGARTRNRGALTNPNSKWSNCQVPYTISKGYSKQERAIIQGAMNQFAKDTGIKWVPRTGNDKNFVNIRSGKGCQSMVGKMQEPGPQELSLGKTF